MDEDPQREKVANYLASKIAGIFKEIEGMVGPSFAVTLLCRNMNAAVDQLEHFVFSTDPDDQAAVAALTTMSQCESEPVDTERGVIATKH